MFEELNQNLILVSSKFIKQKEYWKRKLSGDISERELAFGVHRYKLEDQKGFEKIGFIFPGDLSGKLMRLSNRNDLALYITLLAALKTIIFRFTGKGNIMVLSPVYKPNETEETINDILLIYDILQHDMSLKELLLNTRQSVLEAYENQDYPFEILMESLFDRSNPQDNAITDILCSLENIHHDVNIEERNLGLLFSFLRQGDEIKGEIRYDIGIYDRNFLGKTPAYLVNLLNEFFQNTDLKLPEISFLSEPEKKQLLDDFNDTRLEYPEEKSINELFAGQVHKTPDSIAVVGCLAGAGYDAVSAPGRQESQRFIAAVTYQELKKKADQLAHVLKLKGIKPDSIVALKVERSLEMFTCILGILKTGGAYLPIALTYPEERIKYILQDSNSEILITTGAHSGGKEMHEVLDLLDTDIYTGKTGIITNANIPTNLVYVIYTSGSTGTPKGVMVEHRQVINLVYGLNEVIYKKYSPYLKVALIAPYEFDASAQQIYASLLLGHCLHIVPDETKVDGVKLLAYFRKYSINISDGTPTHLRLIVQSIGGNTMGLAMKHFLIAGEELPKSVVENLLNGFEDGPPGISNIYGPTETCVDSTFFHITPGKLELYETVPIGRALPNEKVYVLDKKNNPQPIGVPGELLIGGDGVSRGYLNRVQLTREKFIPNPFAFGTRLYRTGDLARWLPAEILEFLGRIDRQVKIRGFRIEVGEIESRLIKRKGIKDAVVVAKGEKKEEVYLCAYIVWENQDETADLREWLSGYLPAYMIPSYFVKLDRLPLTPNGKIDIKALPEPRLKAGEKYVAPRDEMEQKLVEIWIEVLGEGLLNAAPGERPLIGIDDNFFEMGGHSLKATTLIYNIYKELNVDVKIIDLFTNPTIRELGQMIKKSNKLEYIEISPMEEKEYYELSYAQRRLWILCQFEEESTAYNIPSAIIVTGSFHADTFNRAIQTLTDRHESLRTVFISLAGEPRQKIIKKLTFELEQIDIRHLDNEKKKEEARRIYIKLANGVLDLQRGPLFQFKLVRLEDETYLLIYNFHHIIIDGWSLGNIHNEVITLYNAFVREKVNPLPFLELQYKDYSQWHNRIIEMGRFNKSRDYWLEKLKDKPNGIELPTDYPRKPIQTFNGGRVAFIIDKERTLKLRKLAINQNATLFMGMLTLLNIFMYRYTGQKDIIIGAPIANRKHPELQDMIGFLVNTLVYRTQVDPDESFGRLLEKVKRETLDCYQYQDYPFDLLTDQLDLDRDLSQSPLFNIMIAHNNTETQDVALTIEGITVSPYSHREDFNMSKFDLGFIMDEYESGEVYTRIEYNSDLFDRSTIQHMADNFLTLVKNAVVGVDTPIYALDIISAVNYERIIQGFNDTNYQYSCSGITLQELFENQVEQSEEKTALVYNGEKISYRDLNRKANQLAHYLRNQYGIKPNHVMGISIDRSIDMVIALLGIIKSGGAYLAVDPTYPRERVLHILMDSQADLLIIDKMRPELFGGYHGKIIDIHSQKDKIARESTENTAVVNQISDILYVNYTSGSTGTPHGAMLSHDCLTNLIEWQNEKSSIDGSLRCLQFTSLNFCVSFQEIMGTLTSGGELHLIGDIERQDIDYLMDFLIGHQIELLFLPFSYLNFLFNESNRWNRSFNHNLKHIITAGEQLKISAGLKKFLDLNPGLKLHNHYGSTEMHVVTSYTLDASTAGLTPIPPAGKPISNIKIYILDEYLKPVPIGVWGELFVAGKSEILGYINNFALTDQKLVKHPLLSADNKRLYRSGDIGRWKEDGNIELRGRKDFQYKVRGFRVELGEIESKLLSIERIEQCVVVVKEDMSNQKYLVAYVVGDNIDAAGIKKKISRQLPQHMIPHLIILDSLPLMPNGKVDRDNLPDPEIKGNFIQHIHPDRISSLLRNGKDIEKMIPGDSSILSNEAMMEKLLAHFTYLVQKKFFYEELRVSGVDIEIVGERERKQRLKDLQAEPQDPVLIDTGSRVKLLHELFEDQVKKTPGNIAVVENNNITYQELNKKSNQLAGLLRPRGVTTGIITGIMMERSIEMMVGILAILKAGGAYLPIDPVLPTDKIVSLLNECQAGILVTKSGSIKTHSFSLLQNIEFTGLKPHLTAPRPAIEDFDSLPIPNRSLVDYETYSKFIGITIVKNYISLQATRGCPYNCAYCHKIWPKKHAVRSAENIFEELKLYYNMGVKRFSFIDDVFNLDIKNSSRFFELILKNGLDIQIYFPNGLRGDLLTPGYMDLMIEAGTRQVSFALETASPRLQKLVRKNVDIDRMYKNIDYICKKFPHIILDLFTMHGFPTETEKEALMTLDFIKSLKWLHFPYIFILKIYPNTDMEKLALANGVSREAISRSMNLAFHDLPDTLPFDKSFTVNYQAAFLEEYFLLKERLLQVLPYQMKVFTESDIVEKYNSYLPVDIRSFDDLLKFTGITGEELKGERCLDEDSFYVPGLNSKIKKSFPPGKPGKSALRVLLLDLSQYFSQDRELLNDLVEPPLGLMYIMTYLNRYFGSKIKGKIAKSRIDFDNYRELKELLTEFKPDLIGIRTLTLYRDFFHKTVAMIRHWGVDIPVITGGPYATSDYTGILQDGNVDLVVLGEGEITFTELIEKILENGGKLPTERVLKKIAGIVFIPQKEAHPGKLARQIIMLDGIEELLSGESAENLKPVNKPGDLANVFYMLGPVEKQEMVKVSHMSGTRLLSRLKENFPGEKKNKAEFGLVASYVFEPSISRLFGALLQGSGLFIPGEINLENIDSLEFYKKQGRSGPDKKSIYIRLVLEEKSENLKVLPPRSVEYEAPRDELEEKIAAVWSEVLDKEKEIIGINDNFFELGGHSLKATVLISKMHKQLNVKIPLVELFTNPTIRDLSRYIKDSTGEGDYASIEPGEKREYHTLSSAQKRMYILMKMEAGGIAYNMPSVLELEGKLDIRKLEGVFIKLIRRHESLRTAFDTVENMPVQKVHEFHGRGFEIQRFTAPAGKGNPEEIIENFIRPFDLSHAPLLRVGLIEGRDEKHILMVDMHHIISDGTSMNIIIKEFMAFYAGRRLPAVRLHYKDYSGWQGSKAQKEAIKQQEEYWTGQFAGEIPVLDIPTDFTRPSIQSFAGATLGFRLGNEDTRSLKKLASNESVTLYMVLLAIYNIFLSKISRQEEIVVGTPTAGRRHADLQQITGMFINTLAMKNHPTGGKTFKEFVKEVGEKTLEAFNNQDYQYEELVERVVLDRDPSRNPLFDVMFTLQNVDSIEINIAGLKLTPYKREHRISKFDLNLIGVEEDDDLYFTIEYCTALFKKDTIERFTVYLKEIVNSIIRDPGIKIADIGIITAPGKKQVLYEFNRTGTAYPREKMIHRLFEEQVERTPDKPALVFEEKKLTYRAVDESAIQMAIQLRERGVKADTIVGIKVEKSLEMLLGVIGILKAGGGYLPIDVEYPEERKRYILADSRPLVLLTQENYNVQMKSAVKAVEVLKDDIFKGNRDHVELQETNNPGDLAYVIYTSGSTGGPKGVMVNHRSVVRLVKNTNFIKFEENDRLLQTGALEFDASTFEIWGSLLNGLTLYIVSKDKILSAGKLERVIRKNKISTMWLTAPLFNQLAGINLNIFAGFRNLVVGGDVLSPTHINPVKRNYRGLNIINGYGPTENTTFSTTFLIATEYERNIPIGKPIANSTAYIVDKSTKLLPVGVIGQLCVGGDGLARGYLNNTELTKEKFIGSSAVPGERLYQTGDLARWLPDGNIEFIGRIDHQVKIRGFRVELGEIESRLLNIEAVKEVVVTVIERSPGAGHWKEKSFCAYFVSEKEFAVSELRNILSGSLPDYMIPAYFMKIEKMPLTPNGKVDRSTLPAPEAGTEAGYTTPRDETEEKLAEIWSHLLGVEKNSIGIDADFFRLGGHSLMATVLLARIHREFNVQIQLVEIFSLPTIRELGELLKLEVKKIKAAIEPTEEKEYYRLSSPQKRLYTQQQMEPDSIAYNVPEAIEIEGELQKERVETAISKLINWHESLRTSFESIGGETVQRVHDKIEFAIKYDEARDERVKKLVEDFIKPFDLSKTPLLRLGLVKSGEIRYLLMIDIHHIVFDGISRSILIRDFFMLYAGRELPALKLQYRDYSQWQTGAGQKKAVEQQGKYWLRQFREKFPLLNLPTDYDRHNIKRFEGKDINFEIDEDKSRALREWALEEGVTLFMLLIAMYYVLLAKLSGQEDIVVGTAVMGRQHPDLEPIIGMFVNMVALRGYPREETCFRDFLREIKETTLNALENQDYPYENLVEQIPRYRNTAGNSLFDVVFSIQTIEPAVEKISNLKFKPYWYENRVSKFDMTMVVLDKGERLFFNVEYNTEILKQETIEIYIKYFKKIMVTVLENKDCRLKDIKVHDLSAPGLKLLQEEEGDFGF